MAFSYSSHEALFQYAQGIRTELFKRGTASYTFLINDDDKPLALVEITEGPMLNFYLGGDGMLAYFGAQSDDETIQRLYAGDFHRFQANLSPNQHPMGFAQMMLEAAGAQDITFYYERPGYPVRQPVKDEELRLLTRLMRAVLSILRRGAQPLVKKETDRLILSTYAISGRFGDAVTLGHQVLTADQLVKLKPARLDAFTQTRLHKLPKDGQLHELLKLTLGPATKDGVRAFVPAFYFLINLETAEMTLAYGAMEEGDSSAHFMSQFLADTFEKGIGPSQIVVANRLLYERLFHDLKAGGITLEWIRHSYVAEDVLDRLEEILRNMGIS